MAKKGAKDLRIKVTSGGAVSLYLPGHVKHLHDLAMQDPNIKCSELYSTALQAALGDSESKHPLELMITAQTSEVEQLQEMLEAAQGRLESTKSRLPMELAKMEWITNVLGEQQLVEMKLLRLALFFEANITFTFGKYTISKPKTATEGLSRYRELLSRYEATKNGPLPEPSAIPQIENLHPEGGYNSCGKPVCCESIGLSESESTCGHTYYGKTGQVKELPDGRVIEVQGNVFEKSNVGTELCDDLKFRCPDCWNARMKQHHERRDGKDPLRLKPHWEIEELTQEQIQVVQELREQDRWGQKGKGMLEITNESILRLRQKAIVKFGITEWENENPEGASILEQLSITRIGVNSRDDKGNPSPNWEGLPEKGDLRRRLIANMTIEQRKAFKEKNDEYYRLSKERAEYIKSVRLEYDNDTLKDDLAWKNSGYQEKFDISIYNKGWDEHISSSPDVIHPDHIQQVHLELERDRIKIQSVEMNGA